MRIVLLGASGNAGREIARLLTPSLGAGDVMVLAGRDQQRLAATAEVTSGPATIQVETVDAEDDASVQRLVAGATIVVVTASVPQRIPALARIVAEAGADWYDTMLSTRTKIEALRHLEPQLRESGRCFVTDGGFHPGLPAAMVRWAARRIDALETAEVYGGMRLDWRADTLSESTITEMLSEFADFDMTTFRDGTWRKLRWSQCPTVDFGDPIGRKSCVPMYLAEMESLPTDVPTLRRCGFFVGGFSTLMDYVAMPVITVLAKVPALQRMTVGGTRLVPAGQVCAGPRGLVAEQLQLADGMHDPALDGTHVDDEIAHGPAWASGDGPLQVGGAGRADGTGDDIDLVSQRRQPLHGETLVLGHHGHVEFDHRGERVGDEALLVGLLGHAYDLVGVDSRSDLDHGAEPDPAHSYRLVSHVHPALRVVGVAEHRHPLSRRNGEEAQQLAGARCHHQQLLGVEQVAVAAGRRVCRERELLGRRNSDTDVVARVCAVALGRRPLPDQPRRVRVREHVRTVRRR
jgi:hypothetical protein